jgi:hypothetical protein
VVAVSFRSDTRGRVPFAVIGALLLVSSTIYATAVVPGLTSDPVGETVVDQAQTEARMALATAIRTAGRRAARDPVIEPAESGPGTLLVGDSTFRRYLRLLIAAEARDALAVANASAGPVRAGVSLDPIRDMADARAAMGDIRIEPAGNGEYRVSVENLEVSLWRRNRLVETIEYNVTITTPIPALDLHERTETFESRLDAGLREPGFARALTARLFAITWVRGYAQYGGAPITNVLANRHIEAMGNDALLAQQAAVFGAADPRGRRLARRAAVDVALRDGLRGGAEAINRRLQRAQQDALEDTAAERAPTVTLPNSFDESHEYDVDVAADKAFLGFVEGRADPGLDRVLDRVYTAQVRADTRTRFAGAETDETGTIPANGTLLTERHHTSRWLAGGSWSGTGRDATLREFEGTVIVEAETTEYWASGNDTVTTTETRRSTHDVTIELTCAYRPSGLAPSRPHARCPFGSETRSQLREKAMRQVVAAHGGAENIAVGAVRGAGETPWERIDLEPPSGVRSAAYEAAAAVRDDARDVSVSTKTRSIASGANPPSLLASALADRRAGLVDAPGRYGSVEERAVAAARATYLDHLVDRLRSRSAPLDRVQEALADRLGARLPMQPPEGGPETMSTVAATVDSDPAYLSLRSAGSRTAPMAARNVNIFAVPYGDAADTISATLDVGARDTVSLRTAAQTLAAATAAESDAVPLEPRRALRTGVETSLDGVADAYVSELAAVVSRDTARHAVRDAFDRYQDPAARAQAVVNGAMPAAIVAELPGSVDASDRDMATVRLRVAGTSARSSGDVRVDESLVSDVAEAVGDTALGTAKGTSDASVATAEATKAVGTEAGKRAWRRATGNAADGLPAGLPLLPLPGSWYATVNVWTVGVHGSYDRFAVSSYRAVPGRAENGTIEYVREATPVEMDVLGDSGPERLGRNRPIRFSARTGVLIVVPPGGTGVGDTDGNADERSPGW